MNHKRVKRKKNNYEHSILNVPFVGATRGVEEINYVLKTIAYICTVTTHA